MVHGTLRRDLYYRFSTFVLEVPPLRDRRQDIPALVGYFLQRKTRELKRPRPVLDQAALERLCAHDWPGNVRELENVVEGLVAGNALKLSGGAPAEHSGRDGVELLDLPYEDAKAQAIRRFQQRYVPAILAAHENDLTASARRMGISRQGLLNIVRGLEGPLPPAAAESCGTDEA